MTVLELFTSVEVCVYDEAYKYRRLMYKININVK